MTDAPVHQLVGFMAAFEPQALQRLQSMHPGQTALLPGRELGALSAPMALRVALAAQALQAIVARGDALADRLAGRIRSSHRLELLAQLVAVLGSGGALAMLLGDGSDSLKLAGVLLALLGSATAVAVKFLRRDLAGADNGLVAQHGALVKAVAQGVAAAQRLQPHLHSADDLGDPEALARVLEEANTLAGQVYALMKQAGVPMAATALGVSR